MTTPSNAQFARFIKACLDLQDAARSAGIQPDEVAVMLGTQLFDRLRQPIKQFAGQSTDYDCGLLIRGFPIFRAGTSREDCDAFLKQARAYQVAILSGAVGHG